MELRFIRDVDLREIDFVVLKDKKPLFAVECKAGKKVLPKVSTTSETEHLFQSFIKFTKAHLIIMTGIFGFYPLKSFVRLKECRENFSLVHFQVHRKKVETIFRYT